MAVDGEMTKENKKDGAGTSCGAEDETESQSSWNFVGAEVSKNKALSHEGLVGGGKMESSAGAVVTPDA
jgi:hypothetical protein